MDTELASKLAKLLRMLTSNHDGEVLAAASRLVGIVAANDVDWDEALSGSGTLSQEQMQRIYQAGYERGLAEEAAKHPAPRADDWAAAGLARTDEAGDKFDTLTAILAATLKARADGALSAFEISFVDSMNERVAIYGRRSFVSEKQWGVLSRLELKLKHRGYL